MLEFYYRILYQPVTKIGKLNCLSGGSGQGKLGIKTTFFDKGESLDLEDNVGEEQDAEDVELEWIDMDKCEKLNGLYLVLE